MGQVTKKWENTHLVFRNRPAALLAWLPVLLLVVPWALVACGGDDDGGGGPGGDEAYIRDVCGAMGKFQDGLTDLLASSPTTLDQIQELSKDMAKLFNDVADDIDDANPPSDAAEATDSMVEYLRNAADALEAGDTDALNSLSDAPDLSMPDDVQTRLAAAAENVDECDGLGLFSE